MTLLEKFLLGYLGLSLLVAAALCLMASRQTPTPDPDDAESTADDVEPFTDDDGTRWTLPPVPPSQRRLSSRSPLDLVGFELDARFYDVLAPSFREYQ